ncbi:hypothetical protein AGLY_003491 [Aphis glycines]|uniref:Uncharacterized protein n=1 Tax=Aphis glycines TaxID=307491 RepID=A0A6G0TZX8_APHGL|nr:hypothetical protein AGLY_003491 [Aphis glycines]
MMSKKSSITFDTSEGTSQPRKNYSRKYYFTIKLEKIQICKTMFLQALGISDKVVTNICINLKTSSIFSEDLRGKFKHQSTMNSEVNKYILEHINSFPTINSHYIREDLKRKYLKSGLSISKMHRLYLNWIKEKSTLDPRVLNTTLRQYPDIYNNNFNLSFFKPKKDQCDVWEKYKLASPLEKLQCKLNMICI